MIKQIGIAASIWLCASAWSAERFPFVIPGDDASKTITDMSILSPKPAGADGFVEIKDGHFYTGADRLRIWGMNLCFTANFPTHEDADKVAAHLAKLGVNGVRLHHHETSPAPRGVLGKPVNGKRHLDPQQMELQDYFLNQLHQRGVYANINLHVGRSFTEEEGFVTKDRPYATRYDKYVLYFEPRMRELFKEFCREYLTHLNPYRKLRRVDDPGIAMVEITNENSYSRDGAKLAASMPEPYRSEFKRQWNAWLAKKFTSTDALKKSWGAKLEPLGVTLADSATWTTGPGVWKLRTSTEYPLTAQYNQPGPEPGIKALHIAIGKRAPETMMHEFQCPSLVLEPGLLYTFTYWVKADAPRPLHVDVSNAGPGSWNNVGYQENFDVTTQWQKIQKTFRASDKIPGKVRICFKFGGHDAGLSLAGVSLRKGGEMVVVPAGQSVEQKNVEIPVTGWTDVAQEDVRRFMADTETGFIKEITAFLKKDLGVKVPITASQITYHGADIVAETCDYTDIHAYWQHPRFPGKPWDSQNWFIANTPMETVPAADRLLACAPWRLMDRPFTASEWNIPDPNDFAASVVPFAAMIAAMQDWDGVFFFQYSNGGNEWYANKINSYFSFNGQPAKLALLTACANLYRRGDLAPLAQQMAGTLKERLEPTAGLTHRIGIDPKAKAPAKIEASTTKRFSSPDNRVIWDASDTNHAYVQVNAPASRAIWGLVAERKFDLGGIKLEFGATDRNYAALTISSADGLPLEKSKRILLTVVGSAENQGMGWNDKRTTVSNKWGKGPTLVNGIPVTISLPFKIQSIHALDGKGAKLTAVPVNAVGSGSQVKLGPEHQTLWYEIAGF